VAIKKGMGVTAMKIFAQEKLNGKAPVEKLISYSMSLPVAATVIGMPELAHIEENIKVAKAFKPLSRQEMDRMNKEMLPLKASIDHFFMHHIDC
jgi:predicted aldo/keto reductase-like oxidoreductase